MNLSRRNLLRLGALTGSAVAVTSCARGQGRRAEGLPPSSPVLESGSIAISSTERAGDPIWRLLNRAGYGPRLGEFERATQMGLEAYVEEQLNPDGIDDQVADERLDSLELNEQDMSQMMGQEPMESALILREALFERVLFSKRQLYEAVVEFWSDHFNIYIRKNRVMPSLKLLDDRDAIRPHALGNFGELLNASLHSPAMLVYLDNIKNRKGRPNENYARELMELHTLGVGGGYSEQDVQEAARILSGWMVGKEGARQGQVFLNPRQHDDGEKVLLGHFFPANQGKADIAQLVALLASHSATAQFMATKLVRRFVADEPPKGLVQQVADTFSQTNGDIKAMLRVIFLSEDFSKAPPKLKRPYTFMISALRVLHADVRELRPLARWLGLMGQPLFQWAAPNGYPDVAPAWANNLLPRWNFSLALLKNKIKGIRVPFESLLEAAQVNNVHDALTFFATLTLGRPLEQETEKEFEAYIGPHTFTHRTTQQRLKESVAFMLASPAFQWT